MCNGFTSGCLPCCQKRDLMLNTLDISLDTLVFIDGNFEKKCVHVLTKPRLI